MLSTIPTQLRQPHSRRCALSLTVFTALTCLLPMTSTHSAASESPTPASLVLTGGKIVTIDDTQPSAEAVAIHGDRIVSVGTNQEVAKYIGPETRVISLGGRMALPGFIDSHGHFLDLGRSKMVLELSTAEHWSDIVEQVAAAAANRPAGEWIIGHGWHQGKWLEKPANSVEGYPIHNAISKQTPNHPVLLTHGTGHMCFANECAMKLAGVDRNTKAPEGGEILRFPDGRPTGVLRENAMGLVQRVYANQQQQRVPQQQREELLEAIRLASDECLRFGITSFQDAGSSFEEIDLFRELAVAGQLPIRLWVMVIERNAALRQKLAAYRMIGIGDHHLTVRAIKRLVDGALGTHGAWLLEPYDDLPNSRGLETLPIDDLQATCRIALQNDFQMCVHAIGDRANREVLDVFEQRLEEHKRPGQHRWRIEHAQHLHPADIPRFAELGVIASMQTVHATSDGPFVVKRLGAQRSREGAYAWRSLLDQGAIVVNGTDVPVERIDPFANIFAAVTRIMRDGNAFFPEQCMTRQEVLKAYTLDAAYAAFDEDQKGTISVGKLADVVVLSQDLLEVPAEQIPQTEVEMTIVGGKILYSAGGLSQ
jgi:predicted amidohydrolase YtcJ